MKHSYLWFLLALILIPLLLVQLPVNAQTTAVEEEYIQVTVRSGDTLWKIAETYKPQGQDIRKFMYRIEKVNQLDTLVLQPGQVLLIPR